MPDDPQLVGDNDRFSPTKMNNQPTSTAAATASRLHRCGDGEYVPTEHREETKDLLDLSLRELSRLWVVY